MRNQQSNVIIFEELKKWDKYIIFLYRMRKYKIYFLRISRNCKNQQWLKKCIRSGYIENININIDGSFPYFYAHLSYANIDKIYESIFKARPTIINRIISLFQDANIELAYKKNLAQSLSRFYGINFALHQINKLFQSRRYIFIPSDGIDWHRTDGCEIYNYFKLYRAAKEAKADLFDVSNIKFPLWATLNSYLRMMKRKLVTTAKILFFLPLLYVLKVRSLLSRRNAFKKNYKYAIMIISPIRQFANKIQKVDFLIDNDFIKKDEVIFISYHRLESKNRRYLRDSAFDYLDDVGVFISPKNIGKILPFYFSLLFSLGQEEFVLDASLRLIYYYLTWFSFTENIKIGGLVTYCDLSIQSLARNIILKKANCKTYDYMDSLNLGCFYNKKNSDIKHSRVEVGFLSYDYLVCWSDEVIEYLKSCKCYFANYVNLGCFWAEHLKEIKEGKVGFDFKSRLYQRGYRKGMKLIAVFDSNYHADSITNYEDGVKFLQDIFRLLEAFPDIFVVLKEKKPRNLHQKFTNKFEEITAIYNALEEHPRCYNVSETGSPSVIIAASNLTISFPFTSTTFEALAVRNRAIWYDANNKFTGTFYDQIPGLVCHGYEDLFGRVKDLLFNIPDMEYNEYLDKFIKGGIEKYLDGMAITRFRKLLAENTK